MFILGINCMWYFFTLPHAFSVLKIVFSNFCLSNLNICNNLKLFFFEVMVPSSFPSSIYPFVSLFCFFKPFPVLEAWQPELHRGLVDIFVAIITVPMTNSRTAEKGICHLFSLRASIAVGISELGFRYGNEYFSLRSCSWQKNAGERKGGG